MSDRVLLVDYGGVLTGSVGASFRSFEADYGLEQGTVFSVLSTVYSSANAGLIGQLERGEVSTLDFERTLIERMGELVSDIQPGELLPRMFAHAGPQGQMWDVVARARAAGIRTCLLSNSWGTDWYPQAELEKIFDEQVISGIVGLRKPDPEIYHLTARLMNASPQDCAFVDDLEHNVAVARDLGMHGVVHYDAAETAASLEPFLGVRLWPGGLPT